MAQWQVSKPYPVPSISEDDIPYSMAPSMEKRPRASQNRVVSIASANGTQVAGGLLTFNISAPNHAIKSGSVYLRGKVRVTTAAAAGWGFMGGGGTGVGACDVGSVASCIQRFTLMAQGSVIEQINDYRDLHNLVLTHTNKSYADADASIKELRGLVGATATDYSFALPIFSGVLNSGHHFPAYLCSQVTALFDLNPLLQAVRANTDGQANPTALQISDAYLVYDAIEPDAGYVQAVKARLAGGEMYSLNYVTYKHQQLANAATISALQGLSTSSLRGVLFCKITNAQGVNGATADGYYTDDYTVGGSLDAAQIELYCDGRLINQVQLNSTAVQFSELERTLGRLGDPSLNSQLSAATTLLKIAEFQDRKWMCGISANRVDDFNMAFTGTPCNQLLLKVANADATANTTFNMWAVVDQVVMIDGSGSCRVVQ